MDMTYKTLIENPSLPISPGHVLYKKLRGARTAETVWKHVPRRDFPGVPDPNPT